MAMSVKAPTPIRSAPSSAPLEAMVAKQQSHIEDLVMQNRTLEQMVQKLRAEVTADQSRHDSTLQQLKQQFGIERIEWKSAADSLQSLWRIVYLRAVAELEKERSNVFKMREEVRLGRVARLQRDYRIGMFQTREMELEDRVAEFQEQFEDMRSSYEEEHKKRLDQKEQFRESVLELNEVVGERDQLEKSLFTLRKEHTALLATSGASSTSLERATLQAEGLKSSLAELQEKYAEADRVNKDLLRQLEKWRNLENRESSESEELRTKKVELEVHVKELEAELDEVKNVTKERETKWQGKLQRYKDSLKEHADALKERDDELEQKEGELADLMQQLAENAEQIKVLGAQIDQEREKSRSLFKQVKDSSNKTSQRPSPHQPQVQSPAAVKPPPKPKPVKKPQIRATSEISDGVVEVDEPPPKAKSKKGKQREVEEAESDIEEVPHLPPPKKNKKSAPAPGPSKPRKKPAEANETPEIEIIDASPKPVKRKAAVVASDDEEGATNTKKKRKKTADATTDKEKEKPKPKKKPAGQASAKPKFTQQDSDSEQGEVAVAQKKKKRKINIFPTAQSSAFDWAHLSQGDGGLNIPTELSPVKEGTLAPPRATSNLAKGLSQAFGSHTSRR